MERLDADLDRLHHGGEALVFRVEPGIGKSALLKHASWRAAESGFRTLATFGVESEAELAFAVRSCTTVHVYDAVVMRAGGPVGVVAPAPDLGVIPALRYLALHDPLDGGVV
jgi:hypothetical protein